MNNSGGGILSKNILVIEDTVSVAELIRDMLASAGHRVEVCMTVESALEKYVPSKYDLIITDYTMPRMNGIELSHVIRRLAPEQLILLITGSTFSMMDDPSQNYPINAVLQKPFSVAEFQETVAELLKTLMSSIPPLPALDDSRESKTEPPPIKEGL